MKTRCMCELVVCVCLLACMHVCEWCLCVCVRADKDVCEGVPVCVRVRVRTSVRECVSGYKNMRACVSVCVRVNMCLSVTWVWFERTVEHAGRGCSEGDLSAALRTAVVLTAQPLLRADRQDVEGELLHLQIEQRTWSNVMECCTKAFGQVCMRARALKSPNCVMRLLICSVACMLVCEGVCVCVCVRANDSLQARVLSAMRG